MRKKITSKQALWDLKCNALEEYDWENDRLDIIEKDLEIFEILKNHLYIHQTNAKDFLFLRAMFDLKAIDEVERQESQKIKEWLENDK